MSKLRKERKFFNMMCVFITAIILIAILGFKFSKYLFFKKTAIGTVVSCESLNAVYADGNKVFSFSVEIKTENETINFSAEDRKWASVKKDDKVKAAYFQYPWWDLSKAGTFYEGRLIKKFKQ